MNKPYTYSLTLSQINEALDEHSPLLHPYAERHLKAKLNICIEWANKVADISKPKDCFRNFATLKLGPHSTFPVFGDGNYYNDEIRGFEDWIRYLHIARCTELNVDDSNSSYEKIRLQGGRLLVTEPHMTTSMGVSGEESNHLLDVDDCPPIGLWVDYIDTPEIVEIPQSGGQRYFRNDGYIISYIPQSFIELVQLGIDVNAEECIYWLEDQKHVSGKIIKSWI